MKNRQKGDLKMTNTASIEKLQYNLLVFPNGPICNLKCDYCYYLEKKELYPGCENFQMSEELLEEYISQYVGSQAGPNINFSWQGGEPTLRGLEFFRKAVELQDKYVPPNWKRNNILQTNGTLLTDEWCKFFKENNFLIGISIDGPECLHDIYRKDRKGNPTHKEVEKGLKLLQKYQVEYNVLCTVNNQNVKFPLKIYHYFKANGIKHIQFIPIVKQQKDTAGPESATSKQYANFLITVFNEWITHDIGNIFIQIFEECVTAWAGMKPGLCVFSDNCGLAPVMEYNGDVYSCDHFVFPEYLLGNIMDTPLSELVFSEKQRGFGYKKSELPGVCEKCEYGFICNGGCLRSRINFEGGERKEYFCDSYKQFFGYVNPFMKIIVNDLKTKGNYEDTKKKLNFVYQTKWKNAGRNLPCPCGSGEKYKKCCMGLFIKNEKERTENG